MSKYKITEDLVDEYTRDEFVADNTNRIDRLEEKIKIKDQQIQQLTQRVKELEEERTEQRSVVVHKGDADGSESLTFQEAQERMKEPDRPRHELRAEERDELTEKQEVLYYHVLYNPGKSKEELIRETPFNAGNTVKYLRAIVFEKQWQIPETVMDKFGLEK